MTLPDTQMFGLYIHKFTVNYFHFHWSMQLHLVRLYLLKVQMCCQSVLILTHRSKVHSQTGSHCKLSALGDCVSLSAICVLCCCWLQLYGPEAPGPAFVSSHPLCTSTEPVLSATISLLSLRGVELEAVLNRWAAVSGEWIFSPTGLCRAVIGGWGGEEGKWGKFLTKRLSLVQDKLQESHWDEAKTQVIGEREPERKWEPFFYGQ